LKPVISGGPALLAAALLVLSGCEKTGTTNDKAGTPPVAAKPGGQPPMAGMGAPEGPTDGNEVALKLTGSNSAEELNRALARLDDPALKTDFETAYRHTFSFQKAQRNYPYAIELAQKVAAARPDFAPAYRVLGYGFFNTNDQSRALAAYKKAVDIDPNYGEAHYALAFMYALGDLAAGREHFKKAMALGIPDERGLGERFYPETQ